MFKPKDWLDRVFEIGIIAKGLDGLVELVGGVLLVVLLIFIGYQLHGIALDPSAGLIALTIFDAPIVALTGANTGGSGGFHMIVHRAPHLLHRRER